jgi:hypothetical protein
MIMWNKSTFCIACKDNDIDRVKQQLSVLPDNQTKTVFDYHFLSHLSENPPSTDMLKLLYQYKGGLSSVLHTFDYSIYSRPQITQISDTIYCAYLVHMNIALKINDLHLFKLIFNSLSNNYQNDVVVDVVDKGKTFLMNLILDADFKRNSNKLDLLYRASIKGHTKMVKLLLKNGFTPICHHKLIYEFNGNIIKLYLQYLGQSMIRRQSISSAMTSFIGHYSISEKRKKIIRNCITIEKWKIVLVKFKNVIAFTSMILEFTGKPGSMSWSAAMASFDRNSGRPCNVRDSYLNMDDELCPFTEQHKYYYVMEYYQLKSPGS